jgi:hypothetical protein
MSTSREAALLRVGLALSCLYEFVSSRTVRRYSDLSEEERERFEGFRGVAAEAGMFEPDGAKMISEALDGKLFPRLMAAFKKNTLLSWVRAASGWIVLAGDDSPRGAAIRFAAASEVLAKEGGSMATAPETIGILENEIARRWASLLRECFREVDDETLKEAHKNGPPEDDGVLVWDANFCGFLEKTGADGQEKAENVRAKSRERLARFKVQEAEALELFPLWLPKETSPAFPALVILGQALWRDIVRPRLERAARNPLALVRPVFASPVFTPHIRPNIRETPDGQRVLPGLVEGGLDCRIIPQTDARLLNRIMAGLDKLGTLTGHRVLRWEIETGHRQFLDGLTRPGVDFRKIEVEGGYSAIAEMIGATSGNDIKAIREIIAAQDATIFDFPWAHMGAGHDGRLLIREEIGAARGRKSRVNLILGTMLVPGYASDIKTPSVSAASRKLVPVTGLPPLIGRPNEYGPQVSLSMLLVLYLRDRAAELHEQGMVRLRPVDLQGMARQVGLTDDPGFLADLWRRWQGEDVKGSDPSAPAFVKVNGEHFTLSDHHAAAHQAIVDAGAQEAAGRIRGLGSQEVRAKKQARTLKRGK